MKQDVNTLKECREICAQLLKEPLFGTQRERLEVVRDNLTIVIHKLGHDDLVTGLIVPKKILIEKTPEEWNEVLDRLDKEKNGAE